MIWSDAAPLVDSREGLCLEPVRLIMSLLVFLLFGGGSLFFGSPLVPRGLFMEGTVRCLLARCCLDWCRVLSTYQD